MANVGRRNKLPAILILFVLVVIYFLMQIYGFMTNSTEMVIAYETIHNTSFVSRGKVIFNSIPIEYDLTQYTQFYADEGEKVSAGDTIAVSFKDSSSAEASQKILMLEEDKEFWETTQNSSLNATDSTKIDDRINELVIDINTLSQEDSMPNIEGLTTELRSMVLKRNVEFDENFSVVDKITEIDAQIAQLQLVSAQGVTTLISPATGYFTQNTYNDENLYQTIDEITLSDINTPSEVNEQYVGKIIDGFDWYFAIETTAENAKLLEGERTVKINFVGNSEKEVPAVIYKTEVFEDGSALVIFYGSRSIDNLVSLNYQQAEIIVNTYEGIYIPSEAIRLYEGEIGVYVSTGNILTFKPIDPIYQEEEFYIIDRKSDLSSVIPNDIVIVSGKNLHGEKIIN